MSIGLALALQTPEVRTTVPVALLSGTMEEKLSSASRWGADGVELMTVAPEELDTGELRRLLARLGLRVAAVASGALAFSAKLTLLNSDPERARRAVERFHSLIEFAASVGAPLVTIGSFRGREAWVEANGRARLAGLVRDAADQAAALGVRLVIEPLNRYEADLILNTEEGLDFLDEINHPGVGLLLDTFHMNIEETSWEEPFVRAMQARRLWHVHVGDNNRSSPGRGLIDFARVIRVLRKLGYEGFLSGEHLPSPDSDTAARDGLTHLRRLLQDIP